MLRFESRDRDKSYAWYPGSQTIWLAIPFDWVTYLTMASKWETRRRNLTSQPCELHLQDPKSVPAPILFFSVCLIPDWPVYLLLVKLSIHLTGFGCAKIPFLVMDQHSSAMQWFLCMTELSFLYDKSRKKFLCYMVIFVPLLKKENDIWLRLCCLQVQEVCSGIVSYPRLNCKDEY
jgi:hypothetical protein